MHVATVPRSRPLDASRGLADTGSRVLGLGILHAVLVGSVAAAPHGDRDRVVVLPLEVDGELPDKWRAEAATRMRTVLERSGLEVVDGARDDGIVCRDRACIRELADTSAHVVRPRLRVDPGTRDYSLVIDVLATSTGDVVASVPGDCQLCGFEDVVAMIEAKAAAATTSIERLRAAVASIELTSTPAGAAIEVDGTPSGTTPTALELAPGMHRVRASKPGFRTQTIEIEAIEGLRKSVELTLVAVAPAATDRDQRRTRALFAAGGVVGGLGVAGIATGAALLAIDGRPHRGDCQADIEGNCRYLYGTKVGGITALAIGAASTVVGIALVAVAARKRSSGRQAARIRFVPSHGLALRW